MKREETNLEKFVEDRVKYYEAKKVNAQEHLEHFEPGTEDHNDFIVDIKLYNQVIQDLRTCNTLEIKPPVEKKKDIFLIIDTWNGQGYSECTAWVKEMYQDESVKQYAEEQAKNNAGEDYEDTIEYAEFSDSTKGYQYEIEDDDGAVYFEPLKDNTLAVMIHPNVNDYEVITTKKRLQEIEELIQECSEDYASDEDQQIYNVVHHATGDDDKDILLRKFDYLEHYGAEDIKCWKCGHEQDHHQRFCVKCNQSLS